MQFEGPGTPKGKNVAGCIRPKNSEGLKVGVYINRRFQRTCVKGSLTLGESTPRENARGKFETSEARSTETMHRC
jgi:hypothetical protein